MDLENEIIGALTTENFRMYHVGVAKKLTVTASIMLTELCNRFLYHRHREELIKKDGEIWFYYSIAMGLDRLGFSREEQDNAFKYLSKFHLIERKVFGLPPKRYFSINLELIRNLMAKVDLDSFESSGNESKKKLKSSSKLECVNYTDCGVSFTHSYSYLEETLKKKHNTKGGGPFSTNSKPQNAVFPCPPFVAHGTHVRLTPDAYDKLCAEHTKTIIDDLIEEMNDYCSSKNPAGYLCYSSALRSWLRRRKDSYPTPKGHVSKSSKAQMAQHRPGAITQEETHEQRVAMGGRRVNPTMYKLFQEQGRDMTGFISDETLA